MPVRQRNEALCLLLEALQEGEDRVAAGWINGEVREETISSFQGLRVLDETYVSAKFLVLYAV